MTKVYPRPASILKAIFAEAAQTERYEAQAVELPNAKLSVALKTGQGDIFFVLGHREYCLPTGSDTAYQLKQIEASTVSQGGRTVEGSYNFTDDVGSRQEVAQLSFKDGRGELTVGPRQMPVVALSRVEEEALASALAGGRIVCVSLPEVRRIGHAFEAPDGDRIVVSSDVNGGGDSRRLFKGKLDDLKEIPIRDCAYFLDGGTTILRTDEGTLYIPTPFNEDRNPTWEGKTVTRLDKEAVSLALGDKAPRVQGVKAFKGP